MQYSCMTLGPGSIESPLSNTTPHPPPLSLKDSISLQLGTLPIWTKVLAAGSGFPPSNALNQAALGAVRHSTASGASIFTRLCGLWEGGFHGELTSDSQLRLLSSSSHFLDSQWYFTWLSNLTIRVGQCGHCWSGAAVFLFRNFSATWLMVLLALSVIILCDSTRCHHTFWMQCSQCAMGHSTCRLLRFGHGLLKTVGNLSDLDLLGIGWEQ